MSAWARRNFNDLTLHLLCFIHVLSYRLQRLFSSTALCFPTLQNEIYGDYALVADDTAFAVSIFPMVSAT